MTDPVKIWWARKFTYAIRVEQAPSQDEMLAGMQEQGFIRATEVYEANNYEHALELAPEKLKEAEEKWQKKKTPTTPSV